MENKTGTTPASRSLYSRGRDDQNTSKQTNKADTKYETFYEESKELKYRIRRGRIMFEV